MSSLLMQELEQGSVIPITEERTIWTIIAVTFSTIGLALSTLALLLLILTAVLFVEWRRSYKNQLLIQFMMARFFYTFFRYFNDIQKVFDGNEHPSHRLMLDIMLLIYSEMALVSWMFVFSRQMYLSFVKVFDPESVSIWKVSLCAWTIPGVISCILFLLYYVKRNTGTVEFMVYTMICKWPVLIVNAVLLVSVLKSVLKSNNLLINNYRSNFKIVVVMMVMIFMFCFQQMFIDVYKMYISLVDDINIVASFLFTGNIIAMYHCAFSTTFWLFGNENTRKLWTFQRREISDKIILNIRFSA